MILAGLWFGYSKPAMWIYLKPFHSSLSELEKDRTTVEVLIGKVKVKSAYGPMWPTRPELIPVSVA